MVISLERGADCLHYRPADATAIPKPHHLLPHLNPDWFYLSGIGLPRLYWKRGREMGVVVLVVVIAMYVHHLGLYCIVFLRFLISKINVALQLTKL